MLETVLYNEMTYWLLFTAVVFTFVGRYMVFRDRLEEIIASTIESLIEDGYLKTKGHGENLEIVKHTEWCEKSN